VQLNPKTAEPENPFLFSSTRSSADPVSTENRKDFASTKNRLSIRPKPTPLQAKHPFQQKEKIKPTTQETRLEFMVVDGGGGASGGKQGL
jgi:hypothetical protein